MVDATPLHGLCPLALAKLASSGISPAQGAALGMYSVQDASTLHKSFAPVPALVIPYDPANPRGFYRIRYLEDPPRGFKQKPIGKYSQPPGSGVEAYLTPGIDWDIIWRDTSVDAIITEGELKAACACNRDFATIGLGGVYNFKTKDTSFLPILETCDWHGRNVYICYDSDAKTNAQVRMAMDRLVGKLRERGANVRIVDLPHDPRYAKVGLDDYLVAHTDEEFKELLAAARDADPPEFFAMNEDVAYIQNIDRFASLNDDLPPMTLSTFTNSSDYAGLTYDVPTFNGRGEASFKSTYVAPAWVKWLRRHVRKAIVYEPGQPRLIDAGLNRWPGWGCESKKGSVKPFLELTDYLFDGEDAKHKEWFLDWCAYPIQNPGVKLAQAVVIHGVVQGTGKTLLGLLVGDIYGDNFYPLTSADLRSAFNSWAHYRQFIVGDEISTGDKREINDRMKAMVTQETVSINIKHQPQFLIRDCINYYFTSNHPDAIYLENFDRRFFVVRVPHMQPRERAFYQNILAWRRANGAAHLRYWLEKRNIDSSFSSGMAAPRTRARQDMVMAGMSDLDRWCAELKDNADAMLVVGQLRHQRDLFTARELLSIYQRDHDPHQRVKIGGMTNALSRAMFDQVYDGKPVRANAGQARYYAVRNAHKWTRPPPKVKVESWLRANIELPPK